MGGSAIAMMIVALVVIWGGLATAIVNLVTAKKKSFED